MAAIIQTESLFAQSDKTVCRRHSMGGYSDKRMGVAVFLLFFLFLRIETAWAVPACPMGAKVAQPDGTEITIYLRGDEYAHWHESEDGFLIAKSEKNREWVYIQEEAGVAVAGRHLVGKADPRAIGALRPNKEKLSAQAALSRTERFTVAKQPALVSPTGTMFNLVVLVNFSDLVVAYPQQDYNDLFNQVGFSADGAVGSVKDYYQQVSYDALTVQSTVVEAVTLDHGYAYYGANNSSGDDIRPREMVEQALAKLEARGFDFRTVDGDGDGWVDGLTIIHAGGGEEYAGNDTNYIWSHEWSLSNKVTYDGISMQMYHTEPARRGWDAYPSTQGITRIGVICHENGHFLGLPDLYDTGGDSEGAGNFCLMAGGSWNGSYGTTPAHMSAWCKSSLGWVSPTVLSTSGVYPLAQVETNAQVYKLQGSFPSTQYFLVENRQGVGFDAGLPGSQRGVLIWHIDETRANNDDQTHYKVDLEEASGTQHLELDLNAGDDADYFRAGNATVFSESTTPNNLGYAGQMLKVNITDVGASGASMPVTIAVVPPGQATSPSPANDASGVSENAVLSWTAGSGATSHDVYFGTSSPGTFQGNQTTTTFTPGTMNNNTTYYWRIDELGFGGKTTGTVWNFTTAPALPWSDGFESNNFTAGGWTKQNPNATVQPSAKYTGTYGARLAQTTWIQKIKSTVGYNTIHVKYDRKVTNVSSITLTVEWSANGGSSWTTLETVSGSTSWASKDYTLGTAADNNASFRIRFRTDSTYNSRYAYIDNVQITYSYTLTINTVGSGTVSKSPDKTTYNPGEVVTLTANPAVGWSFSAWSGDLTGSTNPTTITMNNNKTVTAAFIIQTFTITASAGANGSISPSGAIVKNYGTSQLFTATASTGYEVDKWSVDGGDVQTGGADYTLSNITAAHTVAVTFKILTYTISGKVTINGLAFDGVTMNGLPNNPITSGGGLYSAAVNYGWSGTVTPTKAGYTFTPKTYTNVTSDQMNQDYTGTLLTYTISGYVLEPDVNTPVEGVLIDANNNGGSTDITDVNGYYEVVVPYNWSGTATPTKYAYGFEPNSRAYANVIADQNSQDYAGKLLTYAISGYIQNDCNVPIKGVEVTASAGGNSDITDANGYYEVWVDYNWPGKVTPTKYAYGFEPNSRAYANVLADQTGQDYQAANIYDLDCDGTIGYGDLHVISINWLDDTAENLCDFNGDSIVDFKDFAVFANVLRN